MRKRSVIISAVIVMIISVAFAGCGGSAAYTEGEQFQLEDNTYALEKVVKAIDQDTQSTECYGVSVLMVGDTAPVVMDAGSLAGGGAITPRSAINMTLSDGDKSYTAKDISFAKTDEVEGYGSRATFYFDIPVGEELPSKATLTGTSEEEGIELDLSGLTPEKEMTTAPSTTKSDASNVPDYVPAAGKNGVPRSPEAGTNYYNNEGVGDTSVYDSIGTFEENGVGSSGLD